MKESTIIVMPVYEDFSSCVQLATAINKELNGDAFCIFVDDGSIHTPVTKDIFYASGSVGVIIKLHRNLGHQCAISIGLNYAKKISSENTTIVVMDSDGEDAPEHISTLINALKNKDIDIAVASRKERSESLLFRAFYTAYKFVFKIVTGISIDFGNFMALKYTSLSRLVAMNELSIHLPSTVLASKLRICRCPLNRGQRYAGQSRMNFVTLVLHGIKGMMVFSGEVLTRLGIFCILLALFSLCGIGIASICKILSITTPGWFSLAAGILFIIFLHAATLAVIALMLTGIMQKNVHTRPIMHKFYIKEIIESDR